MFREGREPLTAIRQQAFILTVELLSGHVHLRAVLGPSGCGLHDVIHLSNGGQTRLRIGSQVRPDKVFRSGCCGLPYPIGQPLGIEAVEVKFHELLLHHELCAQMTQYRFTAGQTTGGVGEQHAPMRLIRQVGNLHQETPRQPPLAVASQDGQLDLSLMEVLELRQGHGRAGDNLPALPEQEVLPISGGIGALETSDDGLGVKWRIARHALRPDGFEVVGQGTQVKLRHSSRDEDFKIQQGASKRSSMGCEALVSL